MRRMAATAAAVAVLELAAAGGLSTAEPGGSAALRGLQAWLDGTRDLECRFEQVLLSGALGTGTRERGRLYLRRPGWMRWDYAEPERKIAIVDGDRTLLYLAEDRQLVRGTLEPGQRLLPALLAGESRVTDWFEVAALPPEGAGPGAAPRLRLVPRSTEEGVSEVVLTLRPKDFAIERAEVVDPTGNRIVHSFSSVRRNHGLPPGVLAFEPPPGTEILDRP